MPRSLNHILHDWHKTGESIRSTLQPKCGPYDPRSEEERTDNQKVEHFICCICGDEKTTPYCYDPWSTS